MTANPVPFYKDARAKGLTLVGHELRLVPHKPVKIGSKIPAKQLDNIAACAALGLSYWCEGHGANNVWAADFNGNFFDVHIDRTRLKASADGRTADWGPTPSTVEALSTMLGGDSVPDPDPFAWSDAKYEEYLAKYASKPTAAQKRASKARLEKQQAENDARSAEALGVTVEEYLATMEAAGERIKARGGRKTVKQAAPRARKPKVDSDIDAWADALADELLGEAS